MSRLTDGLSVATLKPERKAERTKYLNRQNCPYDQLEKTLVMLLQNKVDTFTIAIVAKNPLQLATNRPMAKVLVDYYIITWMSEEKL